jgi:hypothetical protein
MRKILVISLFGLLSLPKWGYSQNAQLNTVNNFQDQQNIQLGGKPTSHGVVVNRDGNTTRSGFYQYTGPSTTTIAGVSSGSAMMPAIVDFEVGTGGYRGMLRLNSPINQRIGPGIALNAGPVTGGVEFWLEQNGNFVLRNSATTGAAYLDFPNQNLFFRGENYAYSMLLTKQGRLGLGTTNPETQLHVDATTPILSTGNGGGFKFRDWKNGAVPNTDDWHIYARDGVANIHKVMVGDMMSFNSNNGNVGIGTSTPAHRLDVNGNIGGLDIVSGGINSWVFHTPDATNPDGTAQRKTLYIAPNSPPPNYWNWGAGFAFQETGDLIIRNKLGIGSFPTESVVANLDIRSGNPIVRLTNNTATNATVNQQIGGIEFPTSITGEWKAKINANVGAFSDQPYLTFHTGQAGAEQLRINQEGNVGIGTSSPGTYKLAVEGKIGAREVEIKTGAWADFVFADDYKLPSLTEVEQHIKEKHHLPAIPSEEEVKEKGIALGEMNAKLLQKIEELTLYVIDQQKRIEKLETQLKK